MSDTDSKYPSELAERFQVRLPAGMRDRIKASAAENNRSMNAEIVATLEEKYPAPVDDGIEAAVAIAKSLAAASPSDRRQIAFHLGKLLSDRLGSISEDTARNALEAMINRIEKLEDEGRAPIADDEILNRVIGDISAHPK